VQQNELAALVADFTAKSEMYSGLKRVATLTREVPTLVGKRMLNEFELGTIQQKLRDWQQRHCTRLTSSRRVRPRYRLTAVRPLSLLTRTVHWPPPELYDYATGQTDRTLLTKYLIY
jgi:hypothetical protein